VVRVFGKEGQEEIVRFDPLPAGGFLQAAQDAVIFQPARTARAVDDFAQDDDRAQTALGLVVGRGHLGPAGAEEEPGTGCPRPGDGRSGWSFGMVRGGRPRPLRWSRPGSG